MKWQPFYDALIRKAEWPMDRQDKIDRMLNAVNDWDLEALIDFAQMKLEYEFSKMTNEQIDDEYTEWFLEDDLMGDGEEECCLSSSTQPLFDSSNNRCTCDISTLMSVGCQCRGK